jgi:hypothetical protein
MVNILLRLFGERALHKAVSRGANNPLDVKFGVALLRERRIPFKSKLLAFGMGVGVLALLLAFQVPVEAVATFLAPILLPLDFAIDGFEIVALPILFMSLLLAYVAPRDIVQEIRDERMAFCNGDNGPVIDVQSYDPNAPRALPTTQAVSSVSQPQTPVFAGLRHS